MRNLLIPLFLLFTSSVYASIRVPQIELTKEDAEELGIVFVAKNLKNELGLPAPLVFIELYVDEFTGCPVRDIYVLVNDSYGEVLFGTSIARSFNSAYPFQIQSTYLPYSKLVISCDLGPNSFGQSYILDVSEHLN